VLRDRHALEQADLLEGAAHACAPPHVRRQRRAIAAEIGDASRARREVAADDLEQGRLAGAVGADRAHDLALANRERNLHERDHAAEAARNAFHLERGRRLIQRELPMAFLNTSPTMPLGARSTTTSSIRP